MSDLIYVINNELQSIAPPTIKDVCMEAPRGAYTTMQITQNYIAIDFDLHIERLIKSIAAVHATLNSCYAQYYSSLAEEREDSQQAEAAVLQKAMLPSLLLALSTAEKRFENHQNSLIATIIISPRDNQATPTIATALNIHVAVVANHSAHHHHQLHSNKNNFAVVLGGPRDVPIGKDSGWVTQRQSLETMRPHGAAEILLATRQGGLLEGLVTNLYIITFLEQGDKVVVQTAGMGDGVVWGTMRNRVLEACNVLGLNVVEQPPLAGERALWQEAFLTNALRGVQPLNRIECDVRNVLGLEPWEVEFPEVLGVWTRKIQALVDASLQQTDLRKIFQPSRSV